MWVVGSTSPKDNNHTLKDIEARYTANLSVVIFTAFSHVKFSAVLELYF